MRPASTTGPAWARATLEIACTLDQGFLPVMDHRRVSAETARHFGDRLLTLQGLKSNPGLKLGLVLFALRHRRSPLLQDQQTPDP